jgi:hypothetical protein
MSMTMHEYEKWSVRMKQEQEMNESKAGIGTAYVEKTKQDAPIVVQMNILDKQLSVLQDHIFQLESKLAPVLQEVPPAPQEQPPGIQKQPFGSSALFNGLQSLNGHVTRLQARIIEITERVEV